MAEQSSDQPQNREQLWSQLYRTLRPTISGWVYHSGVASWRGQENDLIEDILQETVVRTFVSLKQAEGSGAPIHNVTGFSNTVAYRLFVDFRRRDLRLIRPSENENAEALFTTEDAQENPAEIAIERLSRISLLETVLTFIADFPTKQRNALFVDLAKRSNLLDEDSPLQIALAQVHIKLQDYLQFLPRSRQERTQQASLLSIAYKRLRQFRGTFQRKNKFG
jgi:DNA-directed RNA polymerase specialized sigma24 family protein